MTHEIPLEDTAVAIADRLKLAAADAARPFVLDCREPDEHAICRIEGATLMPMAEIPERLAELEPWRDKPIVVHCHHGVRSLRVVRFLREKGFAQAQSMKGGIDAWSVEVDPAVPRY